MDSIEPNPKDREIWEEIFAQAPPQWRTAPPDDSMRHCLEFFQQHDVRTVLDLGCGVGLWAVFLSRKGMEVSGVDFSSNAIDYAREWAQDSGWKIRYACGPITERAFPDTTFDAVLAAKILDNVSVEERKIAEARIDEALRPGGVVFALFNPHLTPKQQAELAESGHPTAGITSVRYTDEELAEILPEYGRLGKRTYEHGFRGLLLRKRR